MHSWLIDPVHVPDDLLADLFSSGQGRQCVLADAAATVTALQSVDGLSVRGTALALRPLSCRRSRQVKRSMRAGSATRGAPNGGHGFVHQSTLSGSSMRGAP